MSRATFTDGLIHVDCHGRGPQRYPHPIPVMAEIRSCLQRRKEGVDPITVSVVRHRLHIVEEMGEAMLRTSYSQILNSSRDFSTAICDPTAG